MGNDEYLHSCSRHGAIFGYKIRQTYRLVGSDAVAPVQVLNVT